MTWIEAVKLAVKHERDEAKEEALHVARAYRWKVVQSRGTWLSTADKEGQCHPRKEAEMPVWNGTLREIKDLEQECLWDYPNVTSIYISGGFDAGASLEDIRNHWDMEPCVSNWEIEVWNAETGYILTEELLGEVENV